MRITPNQIAVPIGDKPGTTCKQEARHEAFIIMNDLEMIQQVRVVCLADDGREKAEEIRELGLSPARQTDALKTFEDRLAVAETRGAFIDPATGAIADPMSEGVEVDKLITQKAFFQNLTLGQLEDMGADISREGTLAALMYFMIGGEMGNLYRRERI